MTISTPVRVGLLTALFSLCLPAAATTLVRCKIDRIVVYSDTECPDNVRHPGAGSTAGAKASKPIHIKFARKKKQSRMISKN